jgi:hypothetical protein
MKVFPARCASAGAAHARARRASAALPLALVVMGAQVAAQEQTAAVLKLHEVDFFYRSSLALFSCTDLEGRVASIFRALGARDDIKVMVNGCDAVASTGEPMDPWPNQSGAWQSPGSTWQSSSSRWQSQTDRFGSRRTGREQSAHVRIRMMMPVEVTPEVLAEMEKDKSRRELVSRVTGNPAATLNDPIVFPAQRQLVTLSRRTIDLAPIECELIDQMATSVFRKLDLRVVDKGPHCDRREVSRIPPQVTVEALMPIMPAAPQLTLPPGESNPEPAPAASETESSEPGTATPQE